MVRATGVLRCPNCQHDKLRVLESRPSVSSIRRRRICTRCAHKFTTIETTEVARLNTALMRSVLQDLDAVMTQIREASEDGTTNGV